MKKPLKLPKDRGVYAVTKHNRGSFFLFINEESNNVLNFMQLPDRYKISLTKEEFSEGVVTGLLDFVEQIPEDVFETAKANIEVLEKTS